MLSRRDFLKTGLAGSSLVALGSTVPGFLASTARAAEKGRERILVVVEMTGGNDGLNTVIPFGDDLYYKNRPTLAIEKNDVLRIDDHLGLNPALRPLSDLLEIGRLAVLQGIGYPNPNRSHFESMDVWQSADPRRTLRNGWLGRSLSLLNVQQGRIPAFHVAQDQLPLAMKGSAAVPTLHPDKPFGLQLDGRSGPESEYDYNQQLLQDGQPESPRMKLIRELADAPSDAGSMLQFVQRTSLDTYTTIDRLREIMRSDFEKPEGEFAFDAKSRRAKYVRAGLTYELLLVSRMIQAELGARVYYLSIDGFDTHSDQKGDQDGLLTQLAGGISRFFSELADTGHDKRVLLVTFSEFGRRVRENDSKGTDHGSGSCMFAVGPGVKAGLVGKHPSLEPGELAAGDLKFHTDFRRVYATILDKWLGCDSLRVLGEQFEPLDLLA
jgi:uncharacterized protein (DUF1501 family)